MKTAVIAFALFSLLFVGGCSRQAADTPASGAPATGTPTAAGQPVAPPEPVSPEAEAALPPEPVTDPAYAMEPAAGAQTAPPAMAPLPSAGQVQPSAQQIGPGSNPSGPSGAVAGKNAPPPKQTGAAGVPWYPGARLLKREAEASHEGYRRSQEEKLFTDVDFPSVRNFYDNFVKRVGWQVIGFEDRPGRAQWRLVQSPAVFVEIELKSARAGGVEIKLERKER